MRVGKAMSEEEVSVILEEYPLLLRLGQLRELYKRLGLGGKDRVRAAIAAGAICSQVVYGSRLHYTRASVEVLVRGALSGEGKVGRSRAKSGG